MMITQTSSQIQSDVRWFTLGGCVVHYEDKCEVFLGGTLVGSFGPKDVAARNLLLVGLAENRKIRKGKLSHAFGLSEEHLRRIRKQVEVEGLQALPNRPRGDSETKVTAALRERLYRLFDEGLSAQGAYQALDKRTRVSYRTVCRVRHSWASQRKDNDPVEQRQQELAIVSTQPKPPEKRPEAIGTGSLEDGEVSGEPVRSGKFVQHLGGWLLLGMVERLGLYEAVEETWGGRPGQEALRVCLDAVLLSLGLCQRCVEGVRRIETPSAGILLRASRSPSDSWVRCVLKRYADEVGGAALHVSMTGKYLERASAEARDPAVFYVDNHMRPYTGKHTVRKGWRMQDKRVLPGATDYYVHDEDGRPVFRVDVPSNDHLTEWLTPITRFLRQALGRKQRILVAFDRAGAYPEQLAELRNDSFEFVTYERRPYPVLSPSEFEEAVTVDAEKIGVCEGRTNLGKGRGRVRRISLRMSDGHQVNLLAVSPEPAKRLIGVMLGRWVQENGFKHGNERWGINQLDRRRVRHYAPQTVIPNPARRRLDHALTLARHREGDARNQLARLADGDRRKDKFERDLKTALADQVTLLALRPHTPKHAPLEETELAGRLVYHLGQYKTVLDTLRIACANVESELSCELASHLRKPREAKKALANLFAAPGNVSINKKSITVTLLSAGRKDERDALEVLLEAVNRRRLTLPGDPDRRPLRFRSQL